MLTDDELQRCRDYAHVFGGDGAGSRVLDDLRRAFYVYRSTFVPGDPCETAFNEGARQVVLRITQMMTLEARDKAEGRSAVFEVPDQFNTQEEYTNA